MRDYVHILCNLFRPFHLFHFILVSIQMYSMYPSILSQLITCHPSIAIHSFFLLVPSLQSIHSFILSSIYSFIHHSNLFIYSFTQIFLFHPIPFINYDMIMNDAGDWKYGQINKAMHLQNFFTIEYRRPEMPRDNLVVVIFFNTAVVRTFIILRRAVSGEDQKVFQWSYWLLIFLSLYDKQLWLKISSFQTIWAVLCALWINYSFFFIEHSSLTFMLRY